MITLHGLSLPVSYPVKEEGFLEDFFAMFDGQSIGIGSALTVQPGKMRNVFAWDTAAGSTLTLPAATGSLMRVMAYVSVLATSNSHIMKTSPSTDSFSGIIMGTRTDSGNAVLGFAATVGGGSNSNTITLNRTTTGSVNKGEWVEAMDVASGIWQVRGMLSATGLAFATPFSHV